MPTLTASTPFTIEAAESYADEAVDLLILPQTTGTSALRELRYPDNTYAPLIYPDDPDKWENFDTTPLTAAPLSDIQKTLAGNKAGLWPGYSLDRPVREYWLGDNTKSRMYLYFLRRLAEYFFNPPSNPPYITWWPKDRTPVGYNVILENLTVGGTDVITFHSLAVKADLVLGEIVLTFRVVGVAS